MPQARPIALVLTCEHAGNRVPARYRDLFAGHSELLASHRGWDPGALRLARAIARRVRAPLISTTTTRLLVEPNRSPGHPALFSPITAPLAPPEKARILATHYEPHRARVRDAVRRAAARGILVVHVGVHTFTPVLDAEVRRADIGLLYDPRRARERAWCARWAAGIHAAAPHLRVRRNYPYRGAADGLTTALRREFPPALYLGIELEVNQSLAASPDARARAHLAASLADSLAAALASFRSPRRSARPRASVSSPQRTPRGTRKNPPKSRTNRR